MNIIVVEDEKEVREMLFSLLHEKGHNVVVAEDGRRAIELLSIYKVDLIITDIVMPKIEGIELILRLRQSNIPVISMSGLSKEAVVAELMASLGIIGFLHKPFSNDDLMQIVDNVKGGTDKKVKATLL